MKWLIAGAAALLLVNTVAIASEHTHHHAKHHAQPVDPNQKYRAEYDKAAQRVWDENQKAIDDTNRCGLYAVAGARPKGCPE